MEWLQDEEREEEHRAQAERETRISALALRYRSGDLEALGALYAELAPFIASTIRPHVTGPNRLPPTTSPEDLYQQAYVELAEAVLEWIPDRRGNFVPYFLGSFPWRIGRYLRSQNSGGRRWRFELISTPHDLLMGQLSREPGLDGRDWDRSIACAEILRELPERCREVVRLHLFHGLSFAQVAGRMGIGRSTAHDAFKRAMMLMRAMAE